jgi:hypothetical protein
VPRENNAMSITELQSFVATVEWAALGTLSAEGAPAANLVPIVVQEDHVYFSVPESAAANIARDARCCICADVFPSYHEIKGATVHGAAACVDTSPGGIAHELRRRAKTHGLDVGLIYTLPLLQDSFGFDFGRVQRQL